MRSMRAMVLVRALVVVWALVWVLGGVRAEELLLRQGDRVAIAGDSITEQRLYSQYVETYLQTVYPHLELATIQLGWSGERAPGFAARLDNDLMPWRPTLVTTCYGMNDGGYRPYEEGIGKTYEAAMRDIVVRLKAAGARVIVGGPGVVDSGTYKRMDAAIYNANLAELSAIAKRIAADHGFVHADVHGTMLQAMVAAKAVLGPEFPVAGGDGVHPGPNGQLAMAHAFLKAMGCDGTIGAISWDWLAATATASDGHTVVGVADGTCEIESRRYAFCVFGGPKDAGNAGSILPYLPFQQDLNRFTLTVKGFPAARAKVTWGAASRTFTREQLAAGINLPAEFEGDDNAFAPAFKQVYAVVARKQGFERDMIKGIITNFRALKGMAPDDQELMDLSDKLRTKLMALQDGLQQEVRRAVVPVRHKLAIVPAE